MNQLKYKFCVSLLKIFLMIEWARDRERETNIMASFSFISNERRTKKYKLNQWKIWIVSEMDESSTTKKKKQRQPCANWIAKYDKIVECFVWECGRRQDENRQSKRKTTKTEF